MAEINLDRKPEHIEPSWKATCIAHQLLDSYVYKLQSKWNSEIKIVSRYLHTYTSKYCRDLVLECSIHGPSSSDCFSRHPNEVRERVVYVCRRFRLLSSPGIVHTHWSPRVLSDGVVAVPWSQGWQTRLPLRVLVLLLCVSIVLFLNSFVSWDAGHAVLPISTWTETEEGPLPPSAGLMLRSMVFILLVVYAYYIEIDLSVDKYTRNIALPRQLVMVAHLHI